MNNTDKTMNKEYNRHKGIAYLIFAVITYLIFAFILSVSNIIINHLGIVFIELYFFCFVLLGCLFKPDTKLNPTIISYLIILSIPIYFSFNYRYLMQIDTDDYLIKNMDFKTAIAEIGYTKSNFYSYIPEQCNRFEYKGKAAIFNLFPDNYCKEQEHNKAFSIKENNGHWIDFYGGRNFLRKLNHEGIRYVITEYDPVHIKYITKRMPVNHESVLLAMFSTLKKEKNIVYGFDFEKEPTEFNDVTLKEVKKILNQYSFISAYKKQKSEYVIFSVLFFINALAFSWVIYRINKKYLHK